MKFSSKTDFHGVYRNVGGFIAKKKETFIQANVVSNMQNKNYIYVLYQYAVREAPCVGPLASLEASLFSGWCVMLYRSLVPRPHPSCGGKGSGYNTTSRSTQ